MKKRELKSEVRAAYAYQIGPSKKRRNEKDIPDMPKQQKESRPKPSIERI